MYSSPAITNMPLTTGTPGRNWSTTSKELLSTTTVAEHHCLCSFGNAKWNQKGLPLEIPHHMQQILLSWLYSRSTWATLSQQECWEQQQTYMQHKRCPFVSTFCVYNHCKYIEVRQARTKHSANSRTLKHVLIIWTNKIKCEIHFLGHLLHTFYLKRESSNISRGHHRQYNWT